MTQQSRPKADVSNIGWTPTPLYPQLNEPTPNDTTFVTTANDPACAQFVVQLCQLQQPLAAQLTPGNLVLKVRLQETGTGGVPVTVDLLQGGSVVATRTVTPGSTYATTVMTLTAGEIAAITNYSQLQVRLTVGTCPSSSSSGTLSSTSTSSQTSGGSSATSSSRSSSSSSSSSRSSSSASSSSSSSSSSSRASSSLTSGSSTSSRSSTPSSGTSSSSSSTSSGSSGSGNCCPTLTVPTINVQFTKTSGTGNCAGSATLTRSGSSWVGTYTPSGCATVNLELHCAPLANAIVFSINGVNAGAYNNCLPTSSGITGNAFGCAGCNGDTYMCTLS